MLIMLLDLDLARLVAGAETESILDFLASIPASRSMEPSLGLLERDPGGASLETPGPLDPDVGILDILGLFGLDVLLDSCLSCIFCIVGSS